MLPMAFLSAQSMRDFDTRAIQSGIPGTSLMARASRGLATELLSLQGPLPASALVCAGPGNNGGDGFGLAKLLHESGWRVQVWVAAPAERVKGDARVFLDRATAAGVPVRFLPNPEDWELDPGELPLVNWAVDALLGTGAGGAPRETPAAAIRLLQKLSCESHVLAVDLPSGMRADTGEPEDPSLCVQADHTFTLGAAKAGFLNEASARWTGSVTVIDLGFDAGELATASVAPLSLVLPRQAREAFPRREPDSHKGTFGHVLVIGGSGGMTGAPILAAQAALRGGAGLVSALLPASLAGAVDAAHPSIMVLSGREDDASRLVDQDLDLSSHDTLVIGPGMRHSKQTAALTRRVLKSFPGPIVVDADAIRAFAGCPDDLANARGKLVLTPHPGEMACLLGISTGEVQADRSASVLRAAERSRAVVALKGARTRVADPDGRQWINLNGNPGMATGGSGDVLAGLLGAFLAQGLDPVRATTLAVFLHGRAGDRAALKHSQASLTAMEMLGAI